VEGFTDLADGGAAEQLTSNDVVELDPNWSPDGNTLVFGAHAADIPTRMDSVARSQNTPNFAVPGSAGLFVSRWSPNGRYLIAIPFNAKKFALFDYTTQKWQS